MIEELGVIPVEGRRRAGAIEELVAAQGSFVDFVAVLGLDKQIDFQGSDLRGVDFTNSDLRGFDFSGADLRGSYGLNIALDDTTRFDDADVGSSPFGHVVLQRAITRRNPRFEREYKLLRSAYWADQFPAVYAKIKAADDPTEARLMAMRLFTDSNDAVVRGDMVRVLAGGGLDSDEYCDFLLNVCATRNETPILLAAIDVMASRFKDRRSVFDTLLALTFHPKEQVQVAAFGAIVRSSFFASSRDVVARRLAVGVPPLARGELARRLGPRVAPHGKAIMDYEPFVRAISLDQRLTHRDYEEVALHVSRGDVAVRKTVVIEARQIVAALVEAGLPFRFAGLAETPLASHSDISQVARG